MPSTRSSEQIPMACVAQGSRKLQASRSAFSASGCGRVLYTHARFSPPADENEASAATAMRPAMSARTRAATIRAMPLPVPAPGGALLGVRMVCVVLTNFFQDSTYGERALRDVRGAVTRAPAEADRRR